MIVEAAVLPARSSPTTRSDPPDSAALAPAAAPVIAPSIPANDTVPLADGPTLSIGTTNTTSTSSNAPASAHQPAPSRVGAWWRPPASWLKTATALIIQLGSLAIGLVLWHWASAVDFRFIINFENVPGPLAVWASFQKQLAGKEFLTHIGVSVQRIAIAYTFAAVIGISLGLAMGRSRIIRNMVMPYVEIMRPIPAVAWIPLAILMWPTEEMSIIYITFLGALFPIILNTVAGVEQSSEVLVRAARSLGAKRIQIFRHVILPAAFPSIATGLAVGMGVAWFSLLAGEIISGQYGIGYFTWKSYHLIKYPDIVVGMLAIGLLGTGSTYAVKLLTSPMLRWQRKNR
jgi:NitT/TauT family transport system permease protein